MFATSAVLMDEVAAVFGRVVELAGRDWDGPEANLDGLGDFHNRAFCIV